ncbi:MAG: PHP domain-containing protein [Planctomycetota bacterium]
MVAPAFVHTHVHSHYSLLDGASQVDDLVAAAAKAGQPALALTDHGNLCGAISFYKACKAAGIKPLVGLEAYLAPKSRFDRAKNPVSAHHLILIAMNQTGYRNLIKLSSRSFTEGFYYVPRVDKELLAAHHEGIIAQSACLSGEPCYYLAQRRRRARHRRRRRDEGDLRRPLLPRAAAQRLRRAGGGQPGAREDRAGAARSRSSRRTTCTTWTRTTARPTRCTCASAWARR